MLRRAWAGQAHDLPAGVDPAEAGEEGRGKNWVFVPSFSSWSLFSFAFVATVCCGID